MKYSTERKLKEALDFFAPVLMGIAFLCALSLSLFMGFKLIFSGDVLMSSKEGLIAIRVVGVTIVSWILSVVLYAIRESL